MQQIGKCMLCHRDEQELQKSHFLPTGVYRLTRDQTKSNPNPVILGEANASESLKQIPDYLLVENAKRVSTKMVRNGF